jgi:hypothetical protein
MLARTRSKCGLPVAIHANRNHIPAHVQKACDIHREACVTASVMSCFGAVYKNFGILKHTFELQRKASARRNRFQEKRLSVPAYPT